MKLVKQLRADLDEALKGKQAAETAASMARAEAAEKEELLRKSLAESTTPWGLEMLASNSRRPSIAESICSVSTSQSSSNRSTRSTRESLGSESGRLTRRDRRPRTFNAAATYNTIKPGLAVTRAASLTSDGPQVPTDPNELRESYLRLLEQSERLRAERDKAQQERQELSHKLEEEFEDSQRWNSWDSNKQTLQQGVDNVILSVAADLDPIQEDEPSGPQPVQPQARRAWSEDRSNVTRTSTRAELRKRVTSQRNARSRDGLRSNAAYHNVRLMKKVIDVIETPDIAEERGDAAE